MARHGTLTGYTGDKCRCDDCRAAWREYQRSRWAAMSSGRAPTRHGAEGYASGCRCEVCRGYARTRSRERREQGLPAGDSRHGTITGASSWGCTCDGCKAAWHEYRRQWRSRQRMNGLAEDDSRHGSLSGYHNGCRCDDCKAAYAAQRAERRAGAQGLPDDDQRHGTTAAYTYWRCRCDTCREAQMARQRARRRRKEAEDG